MLSSRYVIVIKILLFLFCSGVNMIFVCSVVLVDKAFTLQFAGKMLSLSAGDVLLIDDTDREDFQPHAAHITEVRLDENIIRRYLESCGGNREADNTVCSGQVILATVLQ